MNLTKYKDFYEKHGYVLLKDYFTEKHGLEIVSYANELEKLQDIPNKYMIYFEGNKNKSRIENFINYHTNIKNIVDNTLTQIINTITNNNNILFKDKMNWKNPGGKGFKPHQDQPAWNDFEPEKYITVALFGNNSTIDNGCLQFAKVDNKITDLLEYDNNGCGQLTSDIINKLNWEHIETTPNDILLFDSYIPHRSDDNNTDDSRRIMYFTYNDIKYGNLYNKYIERKRIEFPPDIERKDNIVNLIGNKYNLANPIS